MTVNLDKYEMEGVRQDTYLANAELHIRKPGEQSKFAVGLSVIALEGKAKITVRSLIDDVKNRIMLRNPSELQEIYDWFLGLPKALADKYPDTNCMFIMDIGESKDMMIIDGRMYPISNKAFIDID